jgi:hypothetical protein
VVLYGCQTWPLTLREEQTEGVENRVLRIFGPKGEEVAGGWKLHNKELHNLYSSPSVMRMVKSRRMGWTSHVALTGEKKSAYRILVGKPDGERILGRQRRRWFNNTSIKIYTYLGEIG